ncbi:MAG: T9SS type A sorting domain-containing protein [Candidatus Marinimicrobia bacterium]|nr:T9SS type A sorting domain-containing protein [Candidatus Neomarinimicrobiota bacterium]
MRKIVTIVLAGAFSMGLFGANLHRPDEVLSAALAKHSEPRTVGVSHTSGQAGTTTGLRENNAVLVDSSQNGYGMISSETNPISVNPFDHNKIIMAYRQYTNGTASGALGMASSVDGGDTWLTYSNLNGNLVDAARYPSALATQNTPVVLWNEYGGGGGEMGGRPYYTFDFLGYSGGFWYPGTNIHPSPLSNDTWYLTPTQNIDGDGNLVINIVASDLAGNQDRLLFRTQSSGSWAGTAALPAHTVTILAENSQDFRFDGTNNYTSGGNMDINDNGVGYFALTSYWNDESVIANHTLFIKKTNDFGATWSDWYHISDDALQTYFTDVFPDSAEFSDGFSQLDSTWSAFVAYDVEVTTDENGGLHVLAPVTPAVTDGIAAYWPGSGIYHFYADEAAFALSSGSIDVSMSFIADMVLTWNTLGGDYSYQHNGMSMATDLNNDSKIYTTYYAVSDTIQVDDQYYAYYDILARYSEDNGLTWSDELNLTQTMDANMDEMYPHMNRFGVDGEVYVMYQMPNYDEHTVPDGDLGEDYLNRIYFLKTTLGAVSVDHAVKQPVSFELKENFPNPFNPSTTIAFSLPTAGMVDLSVYDITGRAVQTLKQGFLSVGEYEYTFTADHLASGTYFYALKSQGFQDVKKMLLIK